MTTNRVIRAHLFGGLLFLALVLHMNPAETAQRSFNLIAWDSGKYVQLNWDTDQTLSTRGYNVYRSVNTSDAWVKLNQEIVSSPGFVDFSAPRSELVFYRVNIVIENDEFPAQIISINTAAKNPASGQLAPTAGYSKNDIISDSQLLDSTALSAAQIQTFLSNQGSPLANYSSGGKTAAQRIYDECQTHGISPYVVLVTLQKEKGLIKNAGANPNNFAMGWSTGDSSTSDFANQIYYGTRQFKLYYNNLSGYGWTVEQSHSVSDGTVTAANTSTAGLYIYTPWIGQGGGGQTGVGGNYLFWDLWFNTFGFGAASSSPSASSVADGFDYPVGKPNATGYAITGWNFLDWTGSVYHPAEDWNGTGGGDTDLGDPVYATANGAVVATGNYGAGWGNIILIRHDLPSGGSVWSQYAHLQTILVSSGNVAKGQQIGKIGKGFNNEYSAHLHFEIRKISMAADAWVSGLSQAQIQDRYYRPSAFINANRTLACGFVVGQGASGSEQSAFVSAHNAAGGQSVMGCPTASVRTDGFTSFEGTIGHYQSFANGDIEYLSNGNRAGQAYALVTAFSSKWASLGYTTSNPLGYPIGVTSQPANSCYGTQNRYQSFEGGSLNQHLSGAKNGQVFEVHGAIHRRWELGGFAICPLGMPLSDETTAQPSGASGSSGKLNQFEGGQIYWKTGASAAYEVHGAIYDEYVDLGGSASWLGFPTSNEFVASTGYARSDFEGGYITTTDGVNYRAFQYGTSSLTINLGTGWNLISLPLQPSNTAITTVLSNIGGKYSAVWAWDGQSQSWRSYFPSSPALANLSTMEAGKGYWVYMTSSGSIPLSGSAPSKTINLVNQWNLVGFNSTTSTSVTNALSSIDGRYVSVWAWKNSTNSYQSYFPNNQLFSDLTTMESGRGYWIYATQSTSWTIP